ncbi:MAG: DUF2723 domain-containing protein, partial [Caldilineaceae bacterium]|nr:DUF2723 domain-containing protein [Caldilineaceae bacterium]
MRRQPNTTGLVATALGIAFFLLYALTAAPSIVELYDDTLEFQLVGPTWGIAHPTGYPLYTLLGAIWSRVLFPIGNWAWRMNLFSALAAATTVGLLFLLAQRTVAAVDHVKAQSAQRFMPGMIAAIAFGLSPIWWSQATVAEVYALHNLLVVTTLLLALALLSTSTSARPTTATLLALGLGLAHHRTIVLLGPGLLVMLWGQGWLWRPSRQWVRWGLALVAPLLLYLYLPLRAMMGVQDLNGSYVNSWNGFWHHVLAAGYAGFFTQNELTRQLMLVDWLDLWLAQYGALGLGLGLLGMGWWLWHGQQRQRGLGLLVTLLVNLLFALLYRVGDPQVFMLPAWLTFAPFVAVGVAALRQLFSKSRPARWAITALLLFATVIGGVGRGSAVNRSQAWAVHDYAVALAKVDFPPESRVIGLEGQITALRYMQQAEKLGLSATGIVANEPSDRYAVTVQTVATGYPTYVTQEIAGIAELYSFSGEGPLVRVWPRGQA